MKITYNFIALLALPLLIHSSAQQTSGTIKNITPGDMKVDFYEHPYPPSLVGFFGFKSGERQTRISHVVTTYIDAECTATFNKDIAGISLPTKRNPNPDIYIIDPQHAYTLEFNEHGRRIVTTMENGKIKEPITFEKKHRANHLAYLINEYIEANQIDEIEKRAPEYRALRNEFPKETNEIETKFGLTNNKNLRTLLAVENNPMKTLTECNKTPKCRVEELD
jgi:hypothetical protein